MYLNFLTGNEQKKCFLQLAYLIAVASPNPSEEEASPLGVRELLIRKSQSISVDHIDPKKTAFNESYGITDQESMCIDGFIKEICLVNDVYTFKNRPEIDSSLHYEATQSIDMIKEVLLSKIKAILDLGFSIENNRQAILTASCDVAVKDIQLSVRQKKSILFELTAMAYADGTCSEDERLLLDHIAKLFVVDMELVGEMLDISNQFILLYQQGLELITE